MCTKAIYAEIFSSFGNLQRCRRNAYVSRLSSFAKRAIAARSVSVSVWGVPSEFNCPTMAGCCNLYGHQRFTFGNELGTA